jgi:hypothetical protein
MKQKTVYGAVQRVHASPQPGYGNGVANIEIQMPWLKKESSRNFDGRIVRIHAQNSMSASRFHERLRLIDAAFHSLRLDAAFHFHVLIDQSIFHTVSEHVQQVRQQ